MNVFSVLRAFFCRRNEGALHIDAAQFSAFSVLMRSGRMADLHQLFLGKCHGSRHDCGNPYAGFIVRNGLDGFFRTITEIIPHTPVEMNVCQSRNRIATCPVHNFLVAFFRLFHKFSPADINILFFKYAVLCIDLRIFYNHCSVPSFRFYFQQFRLP